MRGIKGLVAASLLVAFVCTQCGYILYPDRLGRRSGIIDPEVLVMDCLWLLAGVIPGVIAIIVDFHTGCIYATERELRMRRKQREMQLQFRNPAPAEAEVKVALVEGDRETVLLRAEVDKGDAVEHLRFSLPEGLSPGRYKLVLKVNDVPQAQWDLVVE